MENIEKRIRLLYRDIKKSEGEEDCQDNIDVLEGIKEELISAGKLGRWDLEDVQLGGFFGISEEDIAEANKEMFRQLKKLSKGLGIDLEENVNMQTTYTNNLGNTNPINIHVNPQMIQNQSQSQEIAISAHIESVIRELENEIKKEQPNESKIKSLVEKIISGAKSMAGEILSKIIFGMLR